MRRTIGIIGVSVARKRRPYRASFSPGSGQASASVASAAVKLSTLGVSFQYHVRVKLGVTPGWGGNGWRRAGARQIKLAIEASSPLVANDQALGKLLASTPERMSQPEIKSDRNEASKDY